MTESFAQLYEESVKKAHFRPGDLIEANVVNIKSDFVIVNAGLKSEGIIPIKEFTDEQGEIAVKVGDIVVVAIEVMDDGYGETKLSREKAKSLEDWNRLSKAQDTGELIHGLVTGKVKGGFTVAIGRVRAFLPGSLVDVRPVRDTSFLEGKEWDFKVIKMDAKRNNIVVSRRAAIESEGGADREAFLSALQEGQIIKGIVKNLTDYGAFIDLGGIDGLLHVTDISWKRVKHPSEVLNLGDEIKVMVLKFDKERSRVSLGLKQLADDPWADLVNRYPVNTRLSGKVTNVTDYGCFVEVESGVEGLVHVSEMDWTNKNVNPSKIVQVGQEVDVMVLDVDTERRRISLGLKQCQQNPWEVFTAGHTKGEKITGKIKSITDFGLFIGLEGGIDGLIHLSDLSWSLPGEEAVRQYKKGDEVTAVILTMDPERERIALGVKQLEKDPVAVFLEKYPKGTSVKAKLLEKTVQGAKLSLPEEVEGMLKAEENELTQWNIGDELDVCVTGADKKEGVILVSASSS